MQSHLRDQAQAGIKQVRLPGLQGPLGMILLIAMAEWESFWHEGENEGREPQLVS